MANLADIATGSMDSDTLANLMKLSGSPTSLPLSQASDLANQPTADDQTAQSLAGIASQITPGGNISAILKGVVQGVGLTKKQQAQQKRDAANRYLQQLNQHQIDLTQHQQEMQQILQAGEYAKANQDHLVNGLQIADQFGDTSEVDRFIRANPVMQKVIASQLPDGATYTGVNLQTGPDGVKSLVPVGQLPDGTAVSGSKPMNIDSILSTFAPDVLAARAAARGEALKQGLEIQKKQAEIATEHAQAGKYAAEAKSAASDVSSSHPGQGKAPAGYRWAADGQTLETIPGGPATKPSGTEAGQLAIVTQGQKAVGDIRKIMFNADGSLNKSTLVEASGVNVPFVGKTPAFSEKARELRTAFYNMANAKLRLESGAAVPESEVQRTADAYLAGIMDTPASAEFKLAAPDQYFKDFLHASGREATLNPPPAAGNTSDSTPTTPQSQLLLAPDSIDAELRRRGVLK
ncbi:hypothetical protein [Mesorhizobium sp. B2-3-4]|uniref:hypothetical protein n=1 Tax=Mesorhizobium sp. B2-3-4 TaxID=2589959 RepID=UPI001127D218|nr:hypothetical protein [Mesorhizobium sp. B2-3-4]TPM41423.1 hypothetical protein FJ967_00350 [Mesorhizobium sp. B2-3-4]